MSVYLSQEREGWKLSAWLRGLLAGLLSAFVVLLPAVEASAAALPQDAHSSSERAALSGVAQPSAGLVVRSICASCGDGGGGWTWDECLTYAAAPNSAIVASFSGGYILNCGAVRHIKASGHKPSSNMIGCISKTIRNGRIGPASDPRYQAITWFSMQGLTSWVVFNASNKTIVTSYTAPEGLWNVCVS